MPAALDLYRRVFENPDYNRIDDAGPRLEWALQFVPSEGDLLDVGAGRGRFVRMVRERRPKVVVASCDLARFHDEPGVFFECDLTSEADRFRIGGASNISCLDVLEHLPEHSVRHALQRFRLAAPCVILTVANHHEPGPGGEELHLTRRPYQWWREAIELDAEMPLIAEETFIEGKSWGFVAQGLVTPGARPGAQREV